MMGPGGDGDATSSSASKRRRRPEPTPAQRALGLLVRREHSRRELERKLIQRGIDSSEAGDAVAKLAEAGWQDDARFAEFLVRSKASTGYGPRYIRAELGTHGLSDDEVDAAFACFEGNWGATAADLVRRRFPAAASGEQSARRKATDFLLRRGFSMDHVGEALAANRDAGGDAG